MSGRASAAWVEESAKVAEEKLKMLYWLGGMAVVHRMG